MCSLSVDGLEISDLGPANAQLPRDGARGGGMQQPEAAGVSPSTTEIRKKPPPLSKIPQK